MCRSYFGTATSYSLDDYGLVHVRRDDRPLEDLSSNGEVAVERTLLVVVFLRIVRFRRGFNV